MRELNRLEDLEFNPFDGNVYIAFTNHNRTMMLDNDGVLGGGTLRPDRSGAVFVLAEGGASPATSSSGERAMKLNRAYIALVEEQKFDRGRDAPLAPVRYVFAKIEEPSTGLAEQNRTFQDGRLHLDWQASSGNDAR